MNEKEYNVERARLDVKDAESKLREASNNLTEGYKKQQAILDQAKALFENEYFKLKEEVTRANIKLDTEKAYLKLREDELKLGFTV